MRRILLYLDRLWASDIALTTLLVFLLAYVFIIHPLAQVGSLKFLALVFFSVILISGAIAASSNRIFRTLVFSWSVLTFIFLWVKYFFPNTALVVADLCLTLAFLVLLLVLILGQMLREGPTTSHRVMGAVAAYLLLGLTWSLIYYVIALQLPGAFKGLETAVEGDKEMLRMHFQYFSFAVLTSVGFGDIVPVDPLARMAVVLEGVAGQLFPVVLIARLVSLQLQSKPSEKRRSL
jgi:hypothetical protein